ncbi:hypothetical protein [Burkholderia ubonensis]|uniref:hypothetical protein n=1 Tax=Burkholderia ubonensis TaxID=101571 RepID=UPI00158309F4|nr:hypothetical protein [Burkholderia ubonensis]
MAGIVTLFDDASAYQFELTKRLTAVGPSGEPLTEKYAVDVLNFASELGIISKLPGASVPHLSKYVLTDAGVAIRAARAVDPELEQLILEHLILENDADAYLRALWLLASEPSKSSDNLATDFRDLIFATRQARFEWMQAIFPSKPVLMRLVKGGASQIHWLKANRLGLVDLERPSADFGRHHFSPRKSWATELGHYDSNTKSVTLGGRKFLEYAGWKGSQAANHWISPAIECLKFLRIPEGGVLYGEKAPTLDLLRPQAELCEPDENMISSTRKFLRDAFDHIRLVHARQALTSPVTYFLLAQERKDGKRYNKEALLQAVVRAYGKEIAFFSSRSGTLAYYQLRKSNNG